MSRFRHFAAPAVVGGLVTLGACAHPGGSASVPAPSDTSSASVSTTVPADATAAGSTGAKREPYLPPQLAMLVGLMPLHATGADAFRASDPTHDGRGVLIGILDSGIDPGVPGLKTTTTGEPKLIELRDFSGEGAIPLSQVEPTADGHITVQGITLSGFGRIARLASPPYYGGVLRERPLGNPPAGDVNGDGDADDVFPIIVGKASDGWFLVTDTDGDSSLANSVPIHDYGVARETFHYGTGPLTIAANLSDSAGRPILDLVFDNSGHGTHVSGIAAGHNMFGVQGFDGVAPGAQVMGLKIANDVRGGISVGGSMIRAMNYAAEFAARRGMPLVLNMSFGVGNEREGTATIDSAVDAFETAHPNVVFVISAGNDGPGLSTVGFPGSADFALTACALFPGAFARPPQPGEPPAPDVVGWWSSRGGEVQKPDLCTPGVAFSNVPQWDIGEEVEGGTSMAAPQLAGAAALLESALVERGRTARAVDIKRALMATATPVPGSTVLDVGTGVPNIPAAYTWLLADHQAGRYLIRALPDGGNTSDADAAYRRDGLASRADTLQRFAVTPFGGQSAARVLLRPDVSWLGTPRTLDFHGVPDTVTLTYDAGKLRTPGVYVGTVWARSATDTLAGAEFGLTNTIIVPEPLDRPFAERHRLGPGAVARYFFAVPADAGGFTVGLGTTNDAAATLYLFEPNGQPARTTTSIAVGGDNDPASGEIAVGSEDIVPGIYEADVVAPPLHAATYDLSASIPVVRLAGTPGGFVATTASRTPLSAVVRATLTGAEREVHVTGVGSHAVRIPADAPAWANEAEIDVQLSPTQWPHFTDFGVSIFDADGRLVGDSPMNYAFGRTHISLDSLHTRAVAVELFPAFALPGSDEAWAGQVTIRFLADSARPAMVNGADSAVVRIVAPDTTRFTVTPPDSVYPAPAGYRPVVDVTARDTSGASAHLRAALGGRQ